MKHKTYRLASVLVVVVIGAGIALYLILGPSGNDSEGQPADQKAQSDSRSSKAEVQLRRSASDFEARLQALRQERAGLPTDIPDSGNLDEQQLRFLAVSASGRADNPEQARKIARRELDRIETELATASSDEQRTKLERHRRLVESVLVKLGEPETGE
jgi:hypothetical protein